MRASFLIAIASSLLFLSASCGDGARDLNTAFTEVRIGRWTSLEGGEIFLLRKIGTEWSAKLLGDGERFSCFYVKELKPKSEWNQLYDKLLVAGLGDLSGKEQDLGINDGDGFYVEVTVNGRITKYSVGHADRQKSENAKRMLNISEIIHREFETPVFAPDYERGEVSAYLINNCRELRK